MSGTDEQFWRLLNLKVDTILKAEQHRWAPWMVVIAAAASGGGLVIATAAAMTLILHLTGRI
jgi:polyphosphate kinase 2 (PPK2 family)